MDLDKRQKLLMIVAGSIIGLFLLDKVVLSPYLAAWKDRSERIVVLKQKLEKGNQLRDRAKSLDDQWTQLQKRSLPLAASAAENEVLQAALRWGRDSRVNFNSLLPQPRDHDGGYRTVEVRANATASLAAIAKLLYNLETDSIAVRLEECEIDSHDDHGTQVDLRLRFSGLQLVQTENKPAGTRTTSRATSSRSSGKSSRK